MHGLLFPHIDDSLCSNEYLLLKLPRSSCQCCKQKDEEEGEQPTAKGDLCGWNLKGLKEMSFLRDADIIYANFESEVQFLTGPRCLIYSQKN